MSTAQIGIFCCRLSPARQLCFKLRVQVNLTFWYCLCSLLLPVYSLLGTIWRGISYSVRDPFRDNCRDLKIKQKYMLPLKHKLGLSTLSLLPLNHWPKQITQPDPKSRGKEINSTFREQESAVLLCKDSIQKQDGTHVQGKYILIQFLILFHYIG